MKKNILGFFTFLLLFSALALLLFAPIFAFVNLSVEAEDTLVLYTIPFALLIFLLIPPLLIFYAVHAANNLKIQGQEKALWILFLIGIPVISFPIYFYKFIWKKRG